MGDRASLYYCGAWPLGNRALSGENYFLLLVPLAYRLSVKINDVTSQVRHSFHPALPATHGQERRLVVMVSLFLCAFQRCEADTRAGFVITALLGNMQPGARRL